MTILVFAVAAFLAGALLGLCLKVFLLLPVAGLSLAAIIAVGPTYENSIGFALFVLFLGITALQMGYLLGAVVRVYVADAQART